MEIKNIIDAISSKLVQVFSISNIAIYADDVNLMASTPAFMIQFLSLQQHKQIGRRWYFTSTFNVHYYPQDGHIDASNMALKIQQALREVTLINGSILRSTESKSEIIDGVTHNLINFNFFIEETEVRDLMESITQHSGLKGWLKIDQGKTSSREAA